jgi:hypothetical protein
MIYLDYQTNNPAHGWTGIKFQNWDNYAQALGFLSNIEHYINHGCDKTHWSSSIDIRIEKNYIRGAWNEEYRIHYYEDLTDLHNELIDFYEHKSDGRGSTTCRINSNGYILSLLSAYNFVKTYTNSYTEFIFPPDSAYATVKSILEDNLTSQGIKRNQIDSCLKKFDVGWNM